MKWVECDPGLTPHQFHQIENIARLSPDRELCGLLYPDRMIPLTNTSNDPLAFYAHPVELARVLAIHGEPSAVFHTHPSGDLYPSDADTNGWYYTGSLAVIAALRNGQLQMKSYRLI